MGKTRRVIPISKEDIPKARIPLPNKVEKIETPKTIYKRRRKHIKRDTFMPFIDARLYFSEEWECPP